MDLRTSLPGTGLVGKLGLLFSNTNYRLVLSFQVCHELAAALRGAGRTLSGACGGDKSLKFELRCVRSLPQTGQLRSDRGQRITAAKSLLDETFDYIPNLLVVEYRMSQCESEHARKIERT